MPKINQEEYEILKELIGESVKWICRDEDGDLFVYEIKPNKGNVVWLYRDGSSEIRKISNSDLFQFIQWEDEEPYSIAELIEEYEIEQHIKESVELGEQAIRDHARKEIRKESEETEVKKNIDWLKNQVDETETKIKNLLDGATTHRTRISLNGSLATLKDFRGYIDQLDEPEPKNITLQDVTDKLWGLPLNNRKLWLARLNDEFQEGYIVPLGLKTTDGEEQYLTYNGSYFASRRNKYLQQTFDTLEEIPEFYRELAERVL